MDQRKAPEGTQFPSDVLASNLRAYRLLRHLEQTDIAAKMSSFGHRWTRQTVSDVERGRRNVTTDELLGLVLVVGATIDLLLDPRGPELRTGPALYVSDDVAIEP